MKSQWERGRMLKYLIRCWECPPWHIVHRARTRTQVFWLQEGEGSTYRKGHGLQSQVCPAVLCVCPCTQPCPILSDPMGCSPPGSSVRMSQARILDWVAISSSSGSSQARDRTCIFCAPCIGWWVLYHWRCLESPTLPPPMLSHSPKYSSNL